MAKVKVLLRLPVPEGRIGDTVVVSESRAAMLVDSKYATFVELVVPGADDVEEPVVDTALTPAVTPADGPQVTLPAKTANKAEWEAVAQALGIDTADKTKPELIKAVTDIVG